VVEASRRGKGMTWGLSQIDGGEKKESGRVATVEEAGDGVLRIAGMNENGRFVWQGVSKGVVYSKTPTGRLP
jgi:hypothetical protein